MSILRMGKRVMLVTSEVRIFSLGMRTKRLSKVRILMESRSMDWMIPVVVADPDHVPDGEGLLRDQEQAADDVGHAGLGGEADRDPDDSRRAEEGGELHAQLAEHRHEHEEEARVADDLAGDHLPLRRGLPHDVALGHDGQHADEEQPEHDGDGDPQRLLSARRAKGSGTRS